MALQSPGHHLGQMDECCSAKGREIDELARHGDQRRVLRLVLAISASMFVAEFAAGLIAGSAALVADSVDMLGDAFVNVLSLFALDRSERWRAGDGSCQRLHDPRLWWYRGPRRDWGEDRRAVPPASVWMFVFGGLALVANLSCLRLLWRVRTIDINMSSTFECSRNDVISNFGVLAAAVGVVVFQSAWPDIIVGLTIAFVFFRSAGRVIREAWSQFRSGALVRYPAE